jgi:hypothetical protein
LLRFINAKIVDEYILLRVPDSQRVRSSGCREIAGEPFQGRVPYSAFDVN